MHNNNYKCTYCSYAPRGLSGFGGFIHKLHKTITTSRMKLLTGPSMDNHSQALGQCVHISMSVKNYMEDRN